MFSPLNIEIKTSHNVPKSSKCFSSYMQQPQTHSFFLGPVAPSEVLNLTKKLKSKLNSGHNNISNKLLKETINDIPKPITHVINQSLGTGIVPRKMKIAMLWWQVFAVCMCVFISTFIGVCVCYSLVNLCTYSNNLIWTLLIVLAERGAKVNVVNGSGATPLHDAIVRGNLEVIEELLLCGADIKLAGTEGSVIFVFK